jgi:hypothetical protein
MKQIDRTDFDNLDKDIVAEIAKENGITFHHNCAKRSIVSAILNMDASEAGDEAIRASIAKHTKKSEPKKETAKEDSFTNPKDGQEKPTGAISKKEEKPIAPKTAKEVKIVISELVSNFVKKKDYEGLGAFITFMDGEVSALRTIFKQLSKENTPKVESLSLAEMQLINRKIQDSIVRVEPKKPHRKRRR